MPPITSPEIPSPVLCPLCGGERIAIVEAVQGTIEITRDEATGKYLRDPGGIRLDWNSQQTIVTTVTHFKGTQITKVMNRLVCFQCDHNWNGFVEFLPEE